MHFLTLAIQTDLLPDRPGRQAGRQAAGQASSQVHRHTYMHAYIHTARQRDRQTGGQTYRYAGRQTVSLQNNPRCGKSSTKQCSVQVSVLLPEPLTIPLLSL